MQDPPIAVSRHPLRRPLSELAPQGMAFSLLAESNAAMRCSCAAAVVVLLIGPVAAQQPLTERSTDELIAQLASPDDGLAAQLELRARGPSAAAALASSLRKPHLGGHEQQLGRERAARVLYDLRDRGVPAFDELVACLKDQDLSPWLVSSAAAALVRIAPFAAERRQPLLDVFPAPRGDADAWRREGLTMQQALVSSLAFDGSGAPLLELLDALEGEDPYARSAACAALAARAPTFDSRREEIVAALVAALDRAIPPTQIWRWTANEKQFSSITTVDGWRAMQTEVALALLAYAPDDERCLLGVCQRLWDLDPAVRIAAARWLGDKRLTDAGRWLMEIAEDTSAPAVAFAALDALRRIGPDLAHLAPRIQTLGMRVSDDELVRAQTPRFAALARATARAIDPQLELRPRVTGRVELLAGGVGHAASIDLDEERRRLLAWLDVDQGAQRQRLRNDERLIDEYHALTAGQSGRLSQRIRWLPMRVTPDEFRAGYWSDAGDLRGSELVVASPHDWFGPRWERHREAPWIVVLVPVDTERPRFTATELWGFREVTSSLGPVLECAIHKERSFEFDTVVRDTMVSGDVLLLAVDGLIVASSRRGGHLPRRLQLQVRAGSDDRLAALRNKIE